MIRFRYHRGSLQESMATQVVVSSIESLLKHLHANSPVPLPLNGQQSLARLSCEPYADNDPRVGWVKTFLVSVKGAGPIGFCDHNIFDRSIRT